MPDTDLETVALESLCDAAKAFLGRGQHGLFIDGRSVAASAHGTFETRDPSTGGVLSRLAGGGEPDVDLAVRAARKAFEGPWSLWSPY